MTTFILLPKQETGDHHNYFCCIGRCDYSDPEGLELVAVHEVYDEKLGFSRLYTATGDLFILKTANYGSGWSTCCPAKHDKNLLMDSRIVLFFYESYIKPLFGKARTCSCREQHVCRCRVDEKPMADFLESIGITDAYLSGLKNLEIALISPGKRFQVSEYDGCESVKYFREQDWHNSS